MSRTQLGARALYEKDTPPLILLRHAGEDISDVAVRSRQIFDSAHAYIGHGSQREILGRYISSYLQPESAPQGFLEGNTQAPRVYHTKLLEKHILTITGYLAAAGYQDIEAENLSDPQVEIFHRALESAIMLLQTTLLYGRGIALVLPNGTVRTLSPLQTLDEVYTAENEIHTLEVPTENGTISRYTRGEEGTELTVRDRTGTTTPIVWEYTEDFPAVECMLGRSYPYPAQPYLTKIFDHIYLRDNIIQYCYYYYKTNGHKYLATSNPQGFDAETIEAMRGLFTRVISGLEKGEAHFLGDNNSDEASETILRITDEIIEQDTGIIDLQRYAANRDLSGEALRYKYQSMDIQLKPIYDEWQRTTRKIISLVAQTQRIEPPAVNFRTNTPKSKIDEISLLKMAGASRRTIFERLGIDADEEFRRIQEEQAVFSTASSILADL